MRNIDFMAVWKSCSYFSIIFVRPSLKKRFLKQFVWRHDLKTKPSALFTFRLNENKQQLIAHFIRQCWCFSFNLKIHFFTIEKICSPLTHFEVCRLLMRSKHVFEKYKQAYRKKYNETIGNGGEWGRRPSWGLGVLRGSGAGLRRIFCYTLLLTILNVTETRVLN